MLVKTATNGEQDFNAASNGKANAALTLGIIGTGLGALAGGLNGLGNGVGLFGNGANTAAQNAIAAELYQSPLSEKEYYNRTICNMKDFFNYAQGVSDRICALEQRVAVDETSIAKNFEIENMRSAYENRIIQDQFGCVDTRFNTNDVLTDYKIKAATCDFVKASKFLAPNQLADPYTGSTLVLGSRQMFPYNNCGYGWNYGWGNYGYGNDCGCGCGY